MGAHSVVPFSSSQRTSLVPLAMALHSSGKDLFISTLSQPCVQIYQKQEYVLRFMEGWGSQGKKDGQCSYPSALAVSENEVSDRGYLQSSNSSIYPSRSISSKILSF